MRNQLGLFIHWGVYSVYSWHEQVLARLDIPFEEYDAKATFNLGVYLRLRYPLRRIPLGAPRRSAYLELNKTKISRPFGRFSLYISIFVL